jgi:hypothetical protein
LRPRQTSTPRRHSLLKRRALHRIPAATFVLAWAALLTLGPGPVSSRSSADQALVFQDERPLAITLAQLQAGQDVAICNVGPDPISVVNVRLVGFGLMVGGRPAEDSNLEVTPPVSNPISSRACPPIHISTAQPLFAPDPGTYRGELVVVDKAVEVVRRDIDVTVPAAKSAVGDIVLHATRDGPWAGSALLDDRALILQTNPDGTPAKVAAGGVLGVLHNGNHLATVRPGGPPVTLGSGVLSVPVKAYGLYQVGTYDGAVDVSGHRDPDNAITVNVEVTDRIEWAIAATIAGVLVALIPILIMGRWRHWWRIDMKRRSLAKGYIDAEARFRMNYGDTAFGSYRPHYGSITMYQAKLKSALKNYANSVLVFDPASDGYRAVTASLQTASDDRKALEDPDGLGASLRKLQAALKGFADFLVKEFPVHGDVEGQPAFVTPASGLLNGTALPVGGALQVKAHAAAYVELIDRWKTLALEVKRYLVWGVRLLQHQDRMPIEDLARLRRAMAEVVEARSEMLDAEDADELESLASAGDLKDAYEKLALLGGLYDQWEPPHRAQHDHERALGSVVLADQLAPEGAEYVLRRMPEPTRLVETWSAGAEPPALAPAQGIAIERVSGGVGEAAAVLVPMAAAVGGGLTQFYFGKPWGTTQDYLSVVLAGAGAQVVVKGLVDNVGQIRSRFTGTVRPAAGGGATAASGG